MSRIPPWIAIILSIAIIASVWILGTREMDFMTPPTEAKLEMARTRASQQLAKPSDLFAVPAGPVESPPPAEPPPKEAPDQPEPPPTIQVGDLERSPTLDAWKDEEDTPAASFIELASRLEANTQMAWARVAWERVIDHTPADEDELQAAIKGVLRTRLTPTAMDGDERPRLSLTLAAPRDRVEVTKRAAAGAAEELSKASSELIVFTSKVTPDAELNDELEVGLGIGETRLAMRIPAPGSPTDYADTILRATFRLISSQLAANEGLQPISQPIAGEKPAESLATRITRLGWQSFAAAFAPSE
ncbi:hypothetical protein [Haloferula rosea]|uniref:Uncharacterized protein n=1 Tax=Haloferula rosea TaxID=490093 RepID=A0A934RD02_9BACT|nr:hypothetical protein [Haloferula rosea]MBK1827458.1 hypothetical protein [Haloferula rosea]